MNINQKRVGKFLRDRKWNELKPSDVAKGICIEAAELLEIFQWDSRELAEVKKDKGKIKKVKDEVADVMIYCMEMAELLGFDVDVVVKEKMQRVEKKYDAKLFKSSDEKPGADLYWKIKTADRTKKLSKS